MTDTQIIEIAMQTMMVALKLSAPILATALSIGFVVSLFQSGDGARLDYDFTVLGSLTVLNPVVWENVDFHRLQIEIEES